MVEHATYPQWVLDMIETEFYEPCGNHSASEKAKYCNFFCMDCTRSPFCDLCYNHKVHDGHRVIQVYKSSHCPGVQIPHLRKLFEISEIQPYSINGNFIIYIRQRTSKESSNGSVINQRQRPLRDHKRNCSSETNDHKKKRRCETCQWELTTLQGSPHNYSFCSIECIVKRPKLLRRRRRKGIPIRSPLF